VRRRRRGGHRRAGSARGGVDVGGGERDLVGGEAVGRVDVAEEGEREREKVGGVAGLGWHGRPARVGWFGLACLGFENCDVFAWYWGAVVQRCGGRSLAVLRLVVVANRWFCLPDS
jgi:hypothetical protein